MTTAEQTEPFVSLAINVMFHHEILSGIIGPSARHSCLFYSKIRVHSCPFVVKNLCDLCDLWFLN